MSMSIEEINLFRDKVKELKQYLETRTEELALAIIQRDGFYDQMKNWRNAHLRRYNQAKISQQQFTETKKQEQKLAGALMQKSLELFDSQQKVAALKEVLVDVLPLLHEMHSLNYTFEECTHPACVEWKAILITTTPEEEPQFSQAGYSKHGCHYGIRYTRIGNDEIYDSEDCKECDQERAVTREVLQYPETVCPDCKKGDLYHECGYCGWSTKDISVTKEVDVEKSLSN